MTTLSERLATLTGPDREVDRIVWRMLHPDAEAKAESDIVWQLPRYNVPDDYVEKELKKAVPRYTSNLSAVIAEIERRGWEWSRWCALNRKMSMAVDPPHTSDRFIAQGPTACLALLRSLVAAVEAEAAVGVGP